MWFKRFLYVIPYFLILPVPLRVLLHGKWKGYFSKINHIIVSLKEESPPILSDILSGRMLIIRMTVILMSVYFRVRILSLHILQNLNFLSVLSVSKIILIVMEM